MKPAPLSAEARTCSAPGVCVFRHQAMATRFEVWMAGEEERYGAAAAAAAFGLLDRIELRLSRFIENSDVTRVNRWAGRQAVPVNPRTLVLLQRCLELAAQTEGAFSITAAPGRAEQTRPTHALVELDMRSRTVRLRSPDVQLDLGGVGKGHALDEMAGLLRDWELNRVLLVGGGSSLLALKAPEGREGWPVQLEGRPGRLQLADRGVGASGQAQGAHIVDPRTGHWVKGRSAAWCVARDATSADALSTAAMVLESDAIERVGARLGATEVFTAG